MSAQDVRGPSVLFDIPTTKESSFCFAGECFCLCEELANMPRISAWFFSCLVRPVPNYAGPFIFGYQDGLSTSNFYEGGKLLYLI